MKLNQTKKTTQLPMLFIKNRVKRNILGSDEQGTITSIVDRSTFNIEVKWDSGEGPFYYTYNSKLQEIIKN